MRQRASKRASGEQAARVRAKSEREEVSSERASESETERAVPGGVPGGAGGGSSSIVKVTSQNLRSEFVIRLIQLVENVKNKPLVDIPTAASVERLKQTLAN